MFAVEPSCRAGGRGPIVGRNYDWAVDDLRWCELHRYQSDAGMRRIGYTHHWAGCPDVLNEAGMYVALASLPPQPVRRPGVQWDVVVERISETCATVEEAVAVCGRARHLRSMSYLLADAAGNAAVVEATPDDVRVRRPAGGFIVATNVALGGEPANVAESESGYELAEPLAVRTVSPQGTERARRRLEAATRMIEDAAPEVSEETVRAILSDHSAPICTGDHAHPDGARWATIWSGLCTPADGACEIAPGLPCRHPYRRFSLAL
jgi:hypothetical protein